MVHKPVVVMIRDGWGFRKQEDFNGPIHGETPYTDHLMNTYPHTLIDASGEAVGLPDGYMGNSEVGHMTIGSGRIIYQAMMRINKAIETGEFFTNQVLLDAVAHCKQQKSTLHIIGLLQEEGVHSHIRHCLALLNLCKEQEFENVVVHVVSDGRDAPVMNTVNHLRTLIQAMQALEFGTIGTISGRYYAMDRDKRWDRTKKAYDTIVNGIGGTFNDPIAFLEQCYAQGTTDEFIIPHSAQGYEGLKSKDGVIFFNFRSDRPRQLTQAIVEDEFDGWERKPLDVHYVTMTEYYTPMSKRGHIAFGPIEIRQCLGEVLAKHQMQQLRISETEKYAHVTFFFNGQQETPFSQEDRVLIPSPKVATYDLQPDMSAHKIGDRLNDEIDKDIYDVIIVNYVNGDMVGHTGNWEAVLKAVNAVDVNVKKTCEKVLQKDGIVLVFADHGNCEEMEGKYKTSHTINPVPLIVVSNSPELQKGTVMLKEGKGLKDIAPTVLKLLGIPQPEEMTGESIIE